MKSLYFASKYVASFVTTTTLTNTVTKNTVAGVVTAVTAQLGGGKIAEVAAKAVGISIYSDIQRACYNKLWNIGWYAPDVILATKDLIVKRDAEAVISTMGYIGGALAENCGHFINQGIAYGTSTAVGMVCPVLASPTYYATNAALEYTGVGRIVSNMAGGYVARYTTQKVITALTERKEEAPAPKVFSMSQLDSSQMEWAR